MQRLWRGTLLAVALVACKGESPSSERRAPDKPEVKPSTPAKIADPPPPASPADPSRPRYLRPNPQGVLVDAFRFPSVPASIVEQEVASASTRGEAAGVLRRFGLSALDGRAGKMWIARASLVDRLARERVLVVSFRGDANSEGVRDEDSWLVVLGSTEDDRVLKIGGARITAKTSDDAPLEVDARELHSRDADDIVATWSSCGKSEQKKPCHYLRAWTMERGYPELIVDIVGATKPVVTASVAPPYGIVLDGRVLKFDSASFAYR